MSSGYDDEFWTGRNGLDYDSDEFDYEDDYDYLDDEFEDDYDEEGQW